MQTTHYKRGELMPDVSILELNRLVKDTPKMLVDTAEREYREKIDSLAMRIVGDERIKLVFVSGPSSSGKTTTANLLADKVISLGKRCMVVSLDDFYLDMSAPNYPRHADGTRDLESVMALDLDFLSKTLSNIANDKGFEVPKYEFECSSRIYVKSYPEISRGVVIVEGLHALNPLVFSSVEKSASLKIFISVSTNITLNGERIISGRKLRFVRRMVRDSLYRATSPDVTLERWASVINGENEYLYPTREYADVDFNTFHPYELSLMKPFVEALVTDELREKSELIKTIFSASKLAEPIDISLVPETSLMKEFVPGGIYEDLY